MFSCCFPPPQVEAPSSTALPTALSWEKKLPGTWLFYLSPPSGSCWGVSSSSCSAAGEALSHNKWELLRAARLLQPLLCLAAGAAALNVTMAVTHCLGAGGKVQLLLSRWAQAQHKTSCSGSWPGCLQIIPEKGGCKGPLEVSVPASAEGGGLAYATKTVLFCLLSLRGSWLCLPCATYLSPGAETQLLQPAGESCHRPD